MEFELLATLCTILINVNRKKGSREFRVEDFYSTMRLKGKKQSVEEMKAVMLKIAEANKGQDKRAKGK